MRDNLNQYGQPVGESLVNWSACCFPGDITLTGRFCRVEPLNALLHADDLYAAYSSDVAP